MKHSPLYLYTRGVCRAVAALALALGVIAGATALYDLAWILNG